MNNDLIHYGIGTAFVALVAASAIFGLSQMSTAAQSNAETPAVDAPAASCTFLKIEPDGRDEYFLNVRTAPFQFCTAQILTYA
jgi:hypothetical protein